MNRFICSLIAGVISIASVFNSVAQTPISRAVTVGGTNNVLLQPTAGQLADANDFVRYIVSSNAVFTLARTGSVYYITINSNYFSSSTNFLKKTGDIMYGNLDMGGNSITNVSPSSIYFTDGTVLSIDTNAGSLFIRNPSLSISNELITAVIATGRLSSVVSGSIVSVSFDASGLATGTPLYAFSEIDPTKSSTEYSTLHATAFNNEYVVGDHVYYSGKVYRAKANNDAIVPTSTLYWDLVGDGYRLRQTPVDWNSTSGDAQIINKPIALSEFTNDTGFISSETDAIALSALTNYITVSSFNNFTSDYATADSTTNYTSRITFNNFTSDYATADSTTNYVKRTGDSMSGNLNMQAHAITNVTSLYVDSVKDVDILDFNLAQTNLATEGRLYWNDAKDTLTLGLPGGLEGDVLQTMFAMVNNSESFTLTRGTVVYLAGSSGDMAAVRVASYSNDTLSARTMGIVASDIASGASGLIVTKGVIRKMSTGAYSPGTPLWLGSYGNLQTNRPVAPFHGVFIGVVERSNNGNGLIYVQIQNGFELDELHDVNISGRSANDLIIYNGTVWTNYARTNLALQTSLTNYLPLSGGTMSGTLNMGGYSITNIGSSSLYFTDGTRLSIDTNTHVIVITSPEGKSRSVISSEVTSNNVQTLSDISVATISTGIFGRISGDGSGITNLGVDVVGSQQISIGAIQSDEISSGAVTVDKLDTLSVLGGDLAKLSNTVRVTGVYGKVIPNPATNASKLLATDSSGNWTFTTASLGDMQKSVYDTNNNSVVDRATVADNATYASGIQSKIVSTNNRVDESVVTYDDDTGQYVHRALSSLGYGDMLKSVYDLNTNDTVDVSERATTATTAGTATNALRILSTLITSTGRVDESVLTYDTDTQTYLHRDLASLGSGDMLKATYDIDNDGKVDQLDVASVGTTQLTAGAVTAYTIANGTITSQKVDSTVLTSGRSFSGGDVDGTFNSLTVQKIQGRNISFTNEVANQVLAFNTNGAIVNIGLDQIQLSETDPVFTNWLSSTPPLYSYTETDPTVDGKLTNYYTIVAADSKFATGSPIYSVAGLATGTPLYVESDPSFTNYLPLSGGNISGGITNTDGLAFTGATVSHSSGRSIDFYEGSINGTGSVWYFDSGAPVSFDGYADFNSFAYASLNATNGEEVVNYRTATNLIATLVQNPLTNEVNFIGGQSIPTPVSLVKEGAPNGNTGIEFYDDGSANAGVNIKAADSVVAQFNQTYGGAFSSVLTGDASISGELKLGPLSQTTATLRKDYGPNGFTGLKLNDDDDNIYSKGKFANVEISAGDTLFAQFEDNYTGTTNTFIRFVTTNSAYNTKNGLDYIELAATTTKVVNALSVGGSLTLSQNASNGIEVVNYRTATNLIAQALVESVYQITFAPTVTVSEANGSVQYLRVTNDVVIGIDPSSTNIDSVLTFRLDHISGQVTRLTNNVTYTNVTLSTNRLNTIIYDSPYSRTNWNAYSLGTM